VKHAPAVQLGEARDLGQVVADAGRQQQLSRHAPVPVLQQHRKPAVGLTFGGLDEHVHERDGVVLGQVLASEPQEVTR
jgi:hypothetical protein